MSAPPLRVLFVCPDNSCRSQMAEGWLRHLGGARFVARSAGIAPRHLHPLATRAMQEAGVDVGAQRGKGLDAVRRERFDLVVTLCDTIADELAGVGGAARVVHHPADDPTWFEAADGPDLDEFRRVRDALRAMVTTLVAESAPPGPRP